MRLPTMLTLLVLASLFPFAGHLSAQSLPSDQVADCGLSVAAADTLNLQQTCHPNSNSSIQHPEDYVAYCAGTGAGCTECVSFPGGGTSQTCFRVGGGSFVICISNQIAPSSNL